MDKGMIRLLRAEEIECRIASISGKGLSLLLYKDARVDQRILDETFGLFGWKRSHQCIDGCLYCTVEVYDKDSGIWVSKQDVGAAGYAEKEKSLASDSFKRACFNWGIGRELYTAPFIWIAAEKTSIQKTDGKDKGERFYCSDHFFVKEIGYGENREIEELTIANGKGGTVYEWKKWTGKIGRRKLEGISEEQMLYLKAEMSRTGVGTEMIRERYKIGKLEEISEELYARIIKALARTRTAGAA